MTRSKYGGSLAAASLAIPVIVLLAFAATLMLCRRDPGPAVADHAVFELVLRDAGTHPPLLGPYSRFGWFHPGPLIYYVLLPFYLLFRGGSFALNVGAGALNTLAAVGLAILALRRLNPLVWWALAVGLLVTVQYLTPPVLLDPWNPYLLVLPFTMWLFLAAEAAGGSAWAWPALVALGSFLVQSHVGTAFAVLPLFIVTAGLAAVVRKWGSQRGSPTAARKVALASLGIGLLLWAGPIYDAASRQGGNLARLWEFAGSAPPPEAEETSTRARAGAAQWAGLPLYLGGFVEAVSPSTQHQPVRVAGAPAVSVAAALLLFGIGIAGVRAVRGRAVQPLARAALAVAMLPVSAIYGAKLRGEPLAYLYVWLWGVAPLIAVTLAEGIFGSRSEAGFPGERGSSGPAAIMGLIVTVGCALPLLPAVAHPFEQCTWASQDIRRAQVARLRDGALPRIDQGSCAPLLKWDEPELWAQSTGLLLALAKAGRPVATEPYPGMPPNQPHRPYGDCGWDLHLRRLPVGGANDGAEVAATADDLHLVALARSPIVWGEGWTPPGDWGRWMIGREAFLYLHAGGSGQRQLTFEVAPFETMWEPQTFDVVSEQGAVLVTHVVRGKPWEWQSVSCTVPSFEKGTVTLRVRARRTYPEFRGWRQLTLPVRNLELR